MLFRPPKISQRIKIFAVDSIGSGAPAPEPGLFSISTSCVSAAFDGFVQSPSCLNNVFLMSGPCIAETVTCRHVMSGAQGAEQLPSIVITSYHMLQNLSCDACKGRKEAVCAGPTVSMCHSDNFPAVDRVL